MSKIVSRVQQLQPRLFIKETIQSSISAEHTDPDPLKPVAKAGGGRNVLVLLHCCDRIKGSKS